MHSPDKVTDKNKSSVGMEILYSQQYCVVISVSSFLFLGLLMTLSQVHRLYNIELEDNYTCFLVYLTTLSQLRKLINFEYEDDCLCVFVHLTTLSQLHRLYSIEWRMTVFISWLL